MVDTFWITTVWIFSCFKVNSCLLLLLYLFALKMFNRKHPIFATIPPSVTFVLHRRRYQIVSNDSRLGIPRCHRFPGDFHWKKCNHSWHLKWRRNMRRKKHSFNSEVMIYRRFVFGEENVKWFNCRLLCLAFSNAKYCRHERFSHFHSQTSSTISNFCAFFKAPCTAAMHSLQER